MKRTLTLVALLAAATAASAHTGHGTHSLFEGLSHPFGLDHLLAMVAVGLWSVQALPAHRRWQGPVAFLVAMTAGALAGAGGLSLPGTEAGIALSVSLLGAMLVAGTRLPRALGLGLIALAAGLHGLAHGAELPAGGSFGAYAAGFLLVTAALHLVGLGLGQALQAAKSVAWRVLGLGLGGAGLLLLGAV